jgi:hypothetical protein
MAYNVNGLSQYVKENEGIIVKDIVFGGVYGDTIPLMTKQLGIKTSERIHPSTVEAILQDVETCGFDPIGGLNISERTITTKQKKVNMEFCQETLLNKFAEYKVRVGADEGAMPFEGEILEGLVKSINKQVEEGVWSDLINAQGVETKISASTDAYERIMEAYMAIPEAVLEDAVIFVSPATFRAYVKALVDKNFYHYNPADGDLEEMFIAGSGVKVRKARGLAGTDNIFVTSPKNMIYGTDFMDNKEEIKVWFSDDDDVYKVKVRFNYGAQVAFPDLVVKFAPNA